mgnify:CR=1 FL=1
MTKAGRGAVMAQPRARQAMRYNDTTKEYDQMYLKTINIVV